MGNRAWQLIGANLFLDVILLFASILTGLTVFLSFKSASLDTS